MEQLIIMVKVAHAAGVNMATLRFSLLRSGMSEEESVLLFDIIALETRQEHISLVRAQGVCRLP